MGSFISIKQKVWHGPHLAAQKESISCCSPISWLDGSKPYIPQIIIKGSSYFYIILGRKRAYQSSACGDGCHRFRMILDYPQVMALPILGRLEPMLRDVSSPTLHEVSRCQEVPVGLQVEMLLSSGQLELVMNVVILLVPIIRGASTSSASNGVVMMTQLVAEPLAITGHFSRNNHVILFTVQVGHQFSYC